jgi:hypothetical protein
MPHTGPIDLAHSRGCATSPLRPGPYGPLGRLGFLTYHPFVRFGAPRGPIDLPGAEGLLANLKAGEGAARLRQRNLAIPWVR